MLCHRELIAVSSRQHVLINRKHLSQLQGPALQLAESFVNRGGIAQVQGFLTRFARNHPPSVMLEIIDPHYRAGPANAAIRPTRLDVICPCSVTLLSQLRRGKETCRDRTRNQSPAI